VEDVGAYEVVITASSLSQQASFSWHFEIVDPCTATLVNPLDQTHFTIGVMKPAAEVTLSATDSVSFAYGDRSGLTFCGPRSYSLQGDSQVASMKNGVLKLKAEEKGTYQVEVVTALAQYPSVPAITSQLQVRVICSTETLEFVAKFEDSFVYTVGDFEFITPTWQM